MIYVCITVEGFKGQEYQESLGRIILEPEQENAQGWHFFSYSGDFENSISKTIAFKGAFLSISEMEGKGNFGLFVDGVHVLNCSGQFSRTPLATSVFLSTANIWITVYVQCTPFLFQKPTR